MLSFFEPLKKLCKQEKVAIDNEVFRLHYKVSVILFIMFSAMLTAKQYFGDPIDCFVQGVPAKIVNTYCWVHGTYTMKNYKMDQVRTFTAAEKLYLDQMGHTGTIHPGVGTADPAKNYKVYHMYYQWVGFILFFQAILFYIPRYFWKLQEGGKVKFCTLNMKEPEVDNEERGKRVKRLVKCYHKYQNKNEKYAIKFFLFEIMNLLNVIVQIFYTNKFIGGRFLNYGSQVLNFYQNIDMGIDPLVEVFPKMTKCQFNRHGPGGDINNHDALCLLPLNIVNEKIYLVMWFWLIMLSIASSLAVLYRAACIFLPIVRTYLLWGESSKWSVVSDITTKGDYGDWFLLRQFSKNVDPETFHEFLNQLGKDINPWETNISQSRIPTLKLPTAPNWVGGWYKHRHSNSGLATAENSGKGGDTEPSSGEP